MSLFLSGRAWPFLHESLARLLPSPKDIAGPTLTMAVDMVKIDWNESIIDMLKRLEQGQRHFGRHQHVPLADLMARMKPQDRAGWQAALRQFFNWLPFGEHPQAPDAQVDGTVRFDPALRRIADEAYRVKEHLQGCNWELRLLDSEHMTCCLKTSPVIFDDAEAASLVSSVMDVVGQLCEAQNWAGKVGALRASILSHLKLEHVDMTVDDR